MSTEPKFTPVITDEMIDAARDAIDACNYQGFLYGNRHVVRDLSIKENQEVWSLTTDDYAAGHAAMMGAIVRFVIRVGLEAALSKATSTPTKEAEGAS